MRLIDVDALIPSEVHTVVVRKVDGKEVWESVLYAEQIDNASTVDAEPVRHGRWIYKGVRGRFPVCECSVCGNVENADWAVLGDNVNYCPNCGAKMDGEEK